MQKENVSDEGNKETEKEIETEEVKGLSLRDALEVAVEATKEIKEDVSEDRGADQTGATESPAVDGGGREKASTDTGRPALQAPAEWSADEKIDFTTSTPKQQEAALRLHKARQGTLNEIRAAKKDLDDTKRLTETLAPYIKAIGLKKPTEVALKEAIEMWREFEEGDPDKAAVAYLQAKGRDVPKELLARAQANGPAAPDPEKVALQNRLSSVETKIAREETAKASAVLGGAWNLFEQETNAAGIARFPDLGNTESGIRLASNIGSLVGGQTALSQQFIANAKSRIPGLTYPQLLAEAYKYCGGRVDDSPAPRSQDSQKHIAISRRAASSVPGRGAPGASGTAPKKFKTYREAAEQAMRDLKEAEG